MQGRNTAFSWFLNLLRFSGKRVNIEGVWKKHWRIYLTICITISLLQFSCRYISGFYGKIYSRACVDLSIKLFFFFFLSIFCSNCTCKNWRNIYVISQYSTVARKEKIYILPCILVEIVIVIPINILFEVYNRTSGFKLKIRIFMWLNVIKKNESYIEIEIFSNILCLFALCVNFCIIKFCYKKA